MHQNPTDIALSSGGITEKVPRVQHQRIIKTIWLKSHDWRR